MKKSPLLVQNVATTGKTFCAKEDLVKLLQQHFGHSEFRGKQLQAIEAALSGYAHPCSSNTNLFVLGASLLDF